MCKYIPLGPLKKAYSSKLQNLYRVADMRMSNDLDFNSLIKSHKDLKNIAKQKLYNPEIEFKLKYSHYIDLDVKKADDEMLIGYFDKSSSSQSSDNSPKKEAENDDSESNSGSVSKSEHTSK